MVIQTLLDAVNLVISSAIFAAYPMIHGVLLATSTIIYHQQINGEALIALLGLFVGFVKP